MKRIIPYFILPIFLLCMSACNNKSSKQEKKGTITTDSVDSSGIQKMQESKSEQTIKMKGISYHVVLHRIANDTLSRVKTEAGEWFTDNTISLQITRNNGGKLFSKTFTKKSFSSIVPADFLSHSILEGMVFDKVTEKGLSFAASVCYPQTDLYFPLRITIKPDGSMGMAKEELMEDTYPEDKE
ncbi:DUF4738 domain-containing protein [uncultured Bacteroides sp.]|uniref:DUF4738 domain-containing protein n=1 Tax=uncultured Bacteroides sp. TaxID=162156 RepID=UPI002AABEB42|nr:DUF4738 domain-containing protein [uncultured Bacteroides sp.]